MKFTCPNCDFITNDHDAKFCLKCGAKLVDQDKDEDASKSLIEVENESNSSQSESEDYKCSDCGASVQQEDTCSFCGANTSFSKTANINQSTLSEVDKGNMTKGIFIIALPIVAIFLFFFLEPFDPPSSEVSQSSSHSEYSLKDFDSLITQGEQLMREEKYSEALAKFTEASIKGSAVDKDRLTIAAQKMSEAKLKIAPELLAEAKNLYSQQNYVEAYNRLQSVIEFDPNSTEANTLLPQYEQQKVAVEKKEKEVRRQKSQLALSKLRKDYDEVEETTWYFDKSTPNHINSNTFLIYIGQKSSIDPWLRMQIRYAGERWLFIEQYTIKVDDQTYKIYAGYDGITRDNNTNVWEYYDASPGEDDLRMIKAIISSNKTIIRSHGRDRQEDRVVTSQEKQALQNVLDAYQALGSAI